MLASELINDMIPPLKLTDTIELALTWMDEFRCNQLAVINKGKFLGLITQELILDQEPKSTLIRELELECSHCKVAKSAHFFDIIKLASGNNIELVGVVDEDNEYLGVITIKDTIFAFSQTLAVQTIGAIIVISIKSIDYSLSEISRLVESEGYKIWSSSIKIDQADKELLKLTLKVNSEDIQRLIATLERFGYKVIAQLQTKPNQDADKERIDIFFKYLDL